LQRDLAIAELGLLIAEPDQGEMPYLRSSDELARRQSESYILRRVFRSSTMADILVEKLNGKLTHLTFHHTPGNPTLTIHLTSLFPPGAKQGTLERVVEWMQAYFAGRASVHAATLGIPLGLQIRQSFGFLDTTVTNTAASIRLSFGSEPPEYLEALADALRSFDRDVGTLAAALAIKRGTAKLAAASGTRSDDDESMASSDASDDDEPVASSDASPDEDAEVAAISSSSSSAAAAMSNAPISMEKRHWNPTSEQRKYAAVYQAMLQTDGDVLAYARWVTTNKADSLGKRDTKKGLNDKRSIKMQSLREEARTALRLRLHAAGTLAEVATSALPIQADLDDAAIFAAHLLETLDLAPQQAFELVAHEALRNLRAAAARALAALRSHPRSIGERGNAHSILRNATETIMEASYALAAAVNAHANRDPMAEASERVRRALGRKQARVHFADSGSQAIFNGTLAHMPLEESSGSVAFSATPSVYYETPRVGKALNRPHQPDPASAVNPLAKVKKASAKVKKASAKTKKTSAKAKKKAPKQADDALRAPATSVRIDTVAPYLAEPPQLGHQKPQRRNAAATPATTMIDATNTDPFSPEFLHSLAPSVSMVATSTVKLGQSGSDHLQQGSLIDLNGTAPITPIPMGAQDRQQLAMFEDLRRANEVFSDPARVDADSFAQSPHTFFPPRNRVRRRKQLFPRKFTSASSSPATAAAPSHDQSDQIDQVDPTDP
jgi:hypothetical protein